METFSERVYEVVARIPRGRVLSYGAIARAIGAPGRARYVGYAMRHCPDALPWQRVVRADGSIAGGDFAALRRAMLEDEGVAFLADGRVDMERYAWRMGEDA
ncbi:MAG: MGMT family protein [Eubacteriales bacterium]|nr:MGMT family protein [Clostridiales bacterium]MDY3072948.1 MGMT family protein [Eubacteriales bacterium]MDY5015173.1 MGMT family protein [Eubacteriales bacterium]